MRMVLYFVLQLAFYITCKSLVDYYSSEIIKLPKTQIGSQDFRDYLFEMLDAYYSLVSTNDTIQLGASSLKRLSRIILGIKNTINAYYGGNPFNAYTRLRDTIRDSKLDSIWSGDKFKSNTNFYRLRLSDVNYALDSKELFHIPFHLRTKIQTQRYSIPGFPSLYLSNSIYVAWEEMKRPKLENIQAARFVNTCPIEFIDLTTSRYLNRKYWQRDNIDAYSIILMWPLIAACSIKVKNTNDPFKPEYILPQLLLQWIRNQTAKKKVVFDGIKFSSTHIDLNSSKSKGEFYNLVIPVVDRKTELFCQTTANKFKVTDVVSWQLHQFSTGSPGVIQSYSAKPINPDIERLELMKNHDNPFEFTPFASLELRLKHMKAKPISF